MDASLTLSLCQNSMTALIVAVRGGYTEVVKELLKRNPNVNMTDKDGNTALMIAAMEGHTEIVQDLLDADTYVNIPDRVNTCSRILAFSFDALSSNTLFFAFCF